MLKRLPEKDEVEKIKPFYRCLCLFLCICQVLALVGVLIFGIKEDLIASLLYMAFVLGSMYVSGLIVIKGYPPKFLMWTLAPKHE